MSSKAKQGGWGGWKRFFSQFFSLFSSFMLWHSSGEIMHRRKSFHNTFLDSHTQNSHINFFMNLPRRSINITNYNLIKFSLQRRREKKVSMNVIAFSGFGSRFYGPFSCPFNSRLPAFYCWDGSTWLFQLFVLEITASFYCSPLWDSSSSFSRCVANINDNVHIKW